MNKKVIDLPEVMERVQDDKELLLELFEIFTNDYLQKTQILRSAIVKKNFEEIKDIVHSIKGASGNISAKAVHATCISIEEFCAKKDIAGVEVALPLMDGHFKELRECMAEIRTGFGG